MSTVLITGGTGLVGSALSATLLERGYEVIILTRDPVSARKTHPDQPGLSYAAWDPRKGTIDENVFSEAEHIVHLAGAGVADKRWSQARKKEIVESRVKGGELIINSLRNLPNKIKTVISASGIGWYGPDPEIPNTNSFTESDPAYDDFLGNTCRAWEKSISPATELGKRTVIFRTGIVLSPSGGAIEEFRKPMRFGFSTILGSGRQVISWIHIDDLVELYIRAITDEKMEGVFNAVSPYPVTNRELNVELARSCGKTKTLRVRVPAILLKMVLGELSIEVLKSATVSSNRLPETGFVFRYPRLSDAMKDICKK